MSAKLAMLEKLGSSLQAHCIGLILEQLDSTAIYFEQLPEVFELLRTKFGVQWDAIDFTSALRWYEKGFILEYFHANGCPFSIDVAKAAVDICANSGDRRLMDFLLEKGHPIINDE